MADSTSSPLPALIWNGSRYEPCGGLPVSDRGVRFGMSLFESLAIREGRVEFLQEHLEQLAASCRALGWGGEGSATPSCTDAYAAAGPAMLAAYGPGPVFARIYQTAGDGGPLDPVRSSRIVLFGEPRTAPVPESVRLVVLPSPSLPVVGLEGGLKTANYWPNIQSLQEARALGGDEGLRFNPQGELFSACMANVFLVLESGELVTPALSSGARAGSLRRWVAARREVREARLTRDDVARATECFLTSTWAGVLPASHLLGLGLHSRPLASTVGDALRREFLQSR